jgi:hypothetical protein
MIYLRWAYSLRLEGTFDTLRYAASIRFRPVNQKQLVVQLLPTQQVVHITVRPFTK